MSSTLNVKNAKLHSMETFGQRFQRIRTAQNLSQKFVADALQVSRATISQWESDTAKPDKIRSANLESAAKLLKTSAEYLRTGEQPKLQITASAIYAMSDEEDYDPGSGVMVPVSDIEVSGGPGRVVPEFIETRHKLHFTQAWLRKQGVQADAVRVVRVSGNSMEPNLHNGDSVVLNTADTRVRAGRVYVLAYGMEARVKRLHLLANGTLRIESDNPDKTRFPDEFITPEEMDGVIIIGRVFHKMGSGGL